MLLNGSGPHAFGIHHRNSQMLEDNWVKLQQKLYATTTI